MMQTVRRNEDRPGAVIPTQPQRGGLVVVANRLPVQWVKAADGDSSWEISPGGLVSALRSVLMTGTTWIGWAGSSERHEPPARHRGLELHPLHLDDEEVRHFYGGFANSTLWPLYHDAIFVPQFDTAWWAAYQHVNRRFAKAAAMIAPSRSMVWVHDYHLQLVPAMLREMRSDLRIGFFLHIPFPAQELFMRVPWREQLMLGMLGADVVGLQTEVGAHNVRVIARRLLKRKVVERYVHHGDRRTLVERFPVGIDATRVQRVAADPTTQTRARAIRAELGDPKTVLLGVDRLDYTKGITVRLRAYRELLEEGTIDPASTVLVQIAQPSRDEVPGYAEVRTDVERMVGGINGDFGNMGRVAVKYLHQSQPFEELVALYLAADIMLVTPFRDGMNLVAKEYVAARLDRTGQLILSEFAGAAHELSQATLVNPFDVEGLKSAIANAVKGPMPSSRRRMAALSRTVESNHAERWVTTFLQALAR